MRELVLFVVLFLFCGLAQAEREDVLVSNVDFKILLRSPSENVRSAFSYPFQIQVTNFRAGERRFRFRINSKAYIYDNSLEKELVVPGFQAASFSDALTLPGARTERGSSMAYRSVTVTVFENGIEIGRRAIASASFDSTKTTTQVLFCSDSLRALCSRYVTELELANYNAQIDISALELVPRSLKGLLAFDSILISSGDWERLEADRKDSLKDWVRIGGQLNILAMSYEFGAEFSNGQEQLIGLGSITRHSMKRSLPDGYGGNPSFLEAFPVLAAEENSSLYKLSDSSNSVSWKDVPLASVPIFEIFYALLLYALLVGPVNVFMLRDRKRLPLLYLSTPLISFLGASIGLVFVLLSDGTGSVGRRAVLHMVDKELNRILTLQEEALGSGLLFNRSFETSEDIFLYPVTSPSDSTRHRGYGDRKLRQRELSYSGEWLMSKKRNGFHLLRSKPNRENFHFERRADGKLTVVSTFSNDFDWILLTDNSGRPWFAKTLRPGEVLVMDRLEGREPSAVLVERVHSLDLGASLSKAVQQLIASSGYFLAFSSSANEYAIQHNAKIDWFSDIALFTGPAEIPEVQL